MESGTPSSWEAMLCSCVSKENVAIIFMVSRSTKSHEDLQFKETRTSDDSGDRYLRNVGNHNVKSQKTRIQVTATELKIPSTKGSQTQLRLSGKKNLSVQKTRPYVSGFLWKAINSQLLQKQKKNLFVVFLRPMFAPSKLIFTGSLGIVVQSISLHKEEVINNSSGNKFATVRESNPGGGEIFRTCSDRPWGPPSLLYNRYRVFPGGKVLPGRDADPSLPSSAGGLK